MARPRSQPEPHRVALGDDLRIGQAGEITKLLAQAPKGCAVEIDASHVARIDAAGLQALVRGVSRLRAARIACTWQPVSEKLAAAARVAGLTAALELP